MYDLPFGSFLGAAFHVQKKECPSTFTFRSGGLPKPKNLHKPNLGSQSAREFETLVQISDRDLHIYSPIVADSVKPAKQTRTCNLHNKKLLLETGPAVPPFVEHTKPNNKSSRGTLAEHAYSAAAAHAPNFS